MYQDFKETKSFKVGKLIGMFYTPIFIYFLMIALNNIKIWGSGASGTAFLFAMWSVLFVIISPILAIIVLVLLFKNNNAQNVLDFSAMTFSDWLFYSMVFIFPLFIFISILYSNS